MINVEAQGEDPYADHDDDDNEAFDLKKIIAAFVSFVAVVVLIWFCFLRKEAPEDATIRDVKVTEGAVPVEPPKPKVETVQLESSEDLELASIDEEESKGCPMKLLSDRRAQVAAGSVASIGLLGGIWKCWKYFRPPPPPPGGCKPGEYCPTSTRVGNALGKAMPKKVTDAGRKTGNAVSQLKSKLGNDKKAPYIQKGWIDIVSWIWTAPFHYFGKLMFTGGKFAQEKKFMPKSTSAHTVASVGQGALVLGAAGYYTYLNNSGGREGWVARTKAALWDTCFFFTCMPLRLSHWIFCMAGMSRPKYIRFDDLSPESRKQFDKDSKVIQGKKNKKYILWSMITDPKKQLKSPDSIYEWEKKEVVEEKDKDSKTHKIYLYKTGEDIKETGSWHPVRFWDAMWGFEARQYSKESTTSSPAKKDSEAGEGSGSSGNGADDGDDDENEEKGDAPAPPPRQIKTPVTRSTDVQTKPPRRPVRPRTRVTRGPVLGKCPTHGRGGRPSPSGCCEKWRP